MRYSIRRAAMTPMGLDWTSLPEESYARCAEHAADPTGLAREIADRLTAEHAGESFGVFFCPDGDPFTIHAEPEYVAYVPALAGAA